MYSLIYRLLNYWVARIKIPFEVKSSMCRNINTIFLAFLVHKHILERLWLMVYEIQNKIAK